MKLEFQPIKALRFTTRLSVVLITMLLWGLPFASNSKSSLGFGAYFGVDRPIAKAAPLSLQIITVTNLLDDVNGDTSNISNLNTSPGADGISFREALESSNNTSGLKTIEFAPGLAGGLIYIIGANGAWPTLTSGDLSILGDISGDGIPDITLDGSLGTPNSTSASCIHIWSDNNTINGLKIQNFTGGAIGFGASGDNSTPFTMTGNNILNNTIIDSNIGVGPFGYTSMMDTEHVSNLTWSNITISGNHLISTNNQVGGIALLAAGGSANHNQILNVTITENTLSGYGVGIMAIAADTNSVYNGGPPSPIYYADNNLIQGITIANNQLDDIQYKGIEVGAGNMGNNGNQTRDIVVHDNQVKGRAPYDGIGIVVFVASDSATAAGRVESGNIVANLDVYNNQIEDMNLGIGVTAGETYYSSAGYGVSDNQVLSLTITNNVILRSKQNGIQVISGSSDAGNPSGNNLIENLVIQGNQVFTGTQSWAKGIEIIGGWTKNPCSGCVGSNHINGVEIINNQVMGFDYGLSVVGGNGEGTISNTVTGSQHGNNLLGNTHPYQFMDNLGGAVNNSIGDNWLFKLFLPMLQR